MQDPAGTVATVSEAATALHTALTEIGNTEVRDATAALSTDVDELLALLDRLVTQGDVTASFEVAGAVTDVQASIERITSICRA